MKTSLCIGTKPIIAGTVMPRDDRTRNRVTGGIFLISATISAILVARFKGMRQRGVGTH